MGIFETIDQLIRLGPEFALKFLTAVLCGGAIGMERETTGKPAGLRTSIIVCLGSMLFTVMSIELGKAYGGDGTRIAAQIVTGIGFLGAGVIMRERTGGIRGVTTAAIIWLMAAIGMMIGSGYLISSTAVTAAIVIMVLSLRRVETVIHLRQARDFCFAADDRPEVRERIMLIIGNYEENVRRFSILRGSEPGRIIITFRFAGPNAERRELLRGLYGIESLHSSTMAAEGMS
jgi:putative Mg2+ transporter-C (MgtC) family protein